MLWRIDDSGHQQTFQSLLEATSVGQRGAGVEERVLREGGEFLKGRSQGTGHSSQAE